MVVVARFWRALIRVLQGLRCLPKGPGAQIVDTSPLCNSYIGTLGTKYILRLMDKILHDPKDPKLWELWYIPYNG